MNFQTTLENRYPDTKKALMKSVQQTLYTFLGAFFSFASPLQRRINPFWRQSTGRKTMGYHDHAGNVIVQAKYYEVRNSRMAWTGYVAR